MTFCVSTHPRYTFVNKHLSPFSDGAAAGYGFKRIQAHKSGPHDFENVQFGQDLCGYHEGAIWCMKFSLNGKFNTWDVWVYHLLSSFF